RGRPAAVGALLRVRAAHAGNPATRRRRLVPAREQDLDRSGRGPGAAGLRHRPTRGPRPPARTGGSREGGDLLNLTPEQLAEGRRNFLKALAGTPALAALGAAAVLKGPVRGGPVRVGFIGVGGEGRVLLEQTDPAFAEVRALCDVNPTQLEKADAVLSKTNRP